MTEILHISKCVLLVDRLVNWLIDRSNRESIVSVRIDLLQTFEWPLARNITPDEAVTIQFFNYNKYLTNK